MAPNNHKRPKSARTNEPLTVVVTFAPAPDAQERLRRLANILLAPAADEIEGIPTANADQPEDENK